MSTPELFRDASQPIDKRVGDLLGRMTIEEKVGQCMQLDGGRDKKAVEWVTERHAGSFLHCMHEYCTRLQDAALNQTRLGIPLIFGLDAIHGNCFQAGATIFPSQLGTSCGWNPDLARRVGRATAKELRPTGPHWTFSPVLCLPRDIRWGRVDETFGEDPLLIARLACAMIEGLQGDDFTACDSVLACAKHYAGYGETQGGRDSSEAEHTRRKMLSLFLPPFEAAARAGCATFMTAYQSINGTPCAIDRWLLTEILRETWGSDAFVVTDWNNVGRLTDRATHPVCESDAEAAAKAIRAGNDMIMMTPQFYQGAQDAIAQGLLSIDELDVNVRRILTWKFRIGLFDDKARCYPDTDKIATVIACDEHVALAREAADDSLVLLKNDGILPLKKEAYKTIAVIGPQANDPLAQVGDWVCGSGQAEFFTQDGALENVTTVKAALEAALGDSATILHERGCKAYDYREYPGWAITEGRFFPPWYYEDDIEWFEPAVKAAEKADLCIAVVGDTIPHIGECCDRADMKLDHRQQELIKAVLATGTPLVVVFMASKPHTIPWVVENVPALLCTHNPGQEGGPAIVSALFGNTNPCGKLTMTWPRHIGQQPMAYNRYGGSHGDRYADMLEEPLFAFGYGLSYTSFSYSDLKLEQSQLRTGEPVRASVTVTNTGNRSGTEIVQCYVNDVVTSAMTPSKELKDFARVTLDPGASQTITFELPHDALSFVNEHCQRVVDPGAFELMIGSSSRDCDLLKAEFTVVR